MSNVDQRIVEMKFENHLFEKNVDTSIQSLEKLKDALKFDGAAHGLDSLEKSVNSLQFDKLASNVESLTNRFSALGIAGMTVIQNLTNAALNLASTLARPLTGAINQVIHGGFSRATNIDQAKFKIEGMHESWDEMYSDIDYGVTQTAYGFDAAASAAAQLVASGVEYGKTFGDTGSSPMAHALRGISGVAAMTSSSYEEIASIFTQVAGQGKLMTYQLRMLENRGLNAAAQMGKILNKTEAEIREMATKGEIDFQTFSDAMYKAFGKHATEANNTFEGALSNMKSALSRIGQPVAERFRSNMTKVFNSLRYLFNGVKNAFEDSGLFNQVGRVLDNVGSIAAGVISKFYKITKDEKVIIAPLQKVSEFIAGVVSGIADFLDPIAEGLGKAAEIANTVTNATKEVLDLEQHVEEMANKVRRGDYGNGEERIQRLTEEKEYYELIQNKVNEMLDCSYRYEISEEKIAELYGKNGEKINGNRKGLQKYTEAHGELYEAVGKTTKKTKRELLELEHYEAKRTSAIKKLKRDISDISKSDVIDGIGHAFAGLISVFETIGSVIAAIGKGMFTGLKPTLNILGNAVLDVARKFGTWAIGMKNALTESEFFIKVQEKARVISEAFGKALVFVGDALLGIGSFFLNIGGKIVSVLRQIKTNVDDFFSAFKQTEGYRRISGVFEGIKNRIVDIKDNVLTSASNAIDNFMNKDIQLPAFNATGFADAVSDRIVWLSDKLGALKDSIVGFFQPENGENSIIERLKTWFDDFSLSRGIETLGNAITWIKERFIDLFNLFKSGDGASNFFSSLKDFGGGVFESVTSTLGNFISNFKIQVPSFGQVWDAFMTVMRTIRAVKLQFMINGLMDGIISVERVFHWLNKTVKWGSKVVKYTAKTLKGVFHYLNAEARKSNAEALLKVAEAIAVLAGAFILLTSLDIHSEGFKSAAIALGIITAALAALLLVMSHFNKGRSAMTPIESVSTALGVLNNNIKLFVREIGKGAVIGAFGVAMALLTGAFLKITQVPWKQALASVGIMGLLITEFVVAVKILSKTKEGEGPTIGMAATIIAMAGAITIMASALAKLSKLSLNESLTGTGAITAITTMLSILMHFSAETEDAKIGPLIVIALMIGELVGAIFLLSLLPLPKLAKAVISLVSVFVAFGVMLKAIGTIVPSTGIISMLFIMGAIIAEIALVLDHFSDPKFNPNTLLKISASIALLVGVVGLLMVVFSKVVTGPHTMLTSLIGAVSFDIIVAAIGGFIAGVGALASLLPQSKHNALMKGLDRVAEFMEKVGALLGSFLKGLIFDPAADAAADLPQIGADISTFIENVSPALSGSGGFSLDKFTMVVSMLDTLVDMGHRNVVADIKAKAFSGENSLILLGNDLIEFAGKMQDYATEIDGLPTDLIKTTSRAINSVVKYASVASEIDTTKDYWGNSNIVEVAKELNLFAPEIQKYSEAIAGVKVENLEKTNGVVGVLVELAAAAPAIHDGKGFWDALINGDNRLSTLGANLVPFALGMVAYSWAVVGLNTDAVEKSKSAAEIVIALSQSNSKINIHEDDGSLLGWIIGDNGLGALGENLSSFGKHLVEYANTVAPLVGNESIEATQNLVEIVQALQNSAPNIHKDGFMGWLVGDNSLETLGESLVTFATALVDYNAALTGVDFSNAINATGQIRSLIYYFDKIADAGTAGVDYAGQLLGSVVGWIHDVFSDMSASITTPENMDLLTSVGEAMYSAIISGFNNAGTSGTSDEADTGVVDGLIEALLNHSLSDDTISKLGTDFVEKLITAWQTGLDGKVTSLDEKVKAILDSTITVLDEYRLTYDEHANDTLTEVGDIIGTDTTITSKISTLCGEMVKTARSYVGQFTSIGGEMMSGLAFGILLGQSQVVNAISTNVHAGINRANTELKINSPSKVFMKIGSSVMEGFGKGITNNEHLGTSAILRVADSTIGTMSRSLTDIGEQAESQSMEIFRNLRTMYGYINAVVSESLDVDPKITPVLDLSKIQNGVTGIDSMLARNGVGYSMGLNGLQYARAMYPGTYQYGAEKVTMDTQAGILSQIRGIRSDIAYLGSSIANMQMVMDSGALVGSIGGNVDQKLGNIQKLKERWA